MNDKVSIITATYNAQLFIGNTIDSVLNQTYSNWEMIIVDDCSTDNTFEIAAAYAANNPQIKLYRLDTNSGAAVARNYALKLAEGKYIAFLDSDDLWDRAKLEKQIAFMKHKNIGFSFTSYRIIQEDGTLTGKEVHVPTEVRYTDLLKNTIIGCLTVIIDKQIVGEFEMPLVRAGQDTATWLSILKMGHIAYGYNEVLASYRIVKGSISSNKFKALKRTWNTYRNIEQLGYIRSVYYFSNYVLNAFKKRL